MKQYQDLVNHILQNGETKTNRTGIDTISVFGYQMRFDLRKGFPLLTSKKILFESVVRELLWFLKGSTNINDLHPCKIWDEWADKDGNLGPVYGYQWRHWETYDRLKIAPNPDGETLSVNPTKIDQISNLLEMIKKTPDSRRLIVSAWNVADINKMALPPCHCLFQFNVSGQFIDCQLYQRSADTALGVPFNIASYALLLIMVANECNLIPRHFIHTFGDLHIYVNHIEGLKEQLKRDLFPLPTIGIAKKNVLETTLNDITLYGYQCHPFIKFQVAV
jgi:thymidylate synthase